MQEKSQRQALTKAFCQLRGWLQTSKIPIKTSGYKITATNKSGQNVDISFGGKAEETVAEIAKLNHPKLEFALDEFYRITSILGYSCKSPLRAGSTSKRAFYYNDFDNVAFRHKEFRRVTNPSQEQLDKYKPTQAMALNKFWQKHHAKCQASFLEKSDIIQYLMVWTCNYIGLYEVQDGTLTENQKRLYAYLCQRLSGLMGLVKQKESRNLNDSHALQELYEQRSS